MARRSQRAHHPRPGRRVRQAELSGYGRRKRIMMLALLLVAAQVGTDPRLDRLDPDTRAQVATVMDSASRVGLPTEPLIQRALEGATKAAPGARIVAAVRRPAGGRGGGGPAPPPSIAPLATTRGPPPAPPSPVVAAHLCGRSPSSHWRAEWRPASIKESRKSPRTSKPGFPGFATMAFWGPPRRPFRRRSGGNTRAAVAW